MRRCFSLTAAALLWLLTLSATYAAAEELPRETALDRYIAQPDASYRWKVVKTVPGQGYTTFVIDMTSQTWRTAEDVNRTEWQHWLTVVRPDEVRYETSMLFIGGGSNRGDNPPEAADAKTVALATGTHSVVSELKMIPNQPLQFQGDGQDRYEDDLIAYTWDKYLTTGDETWIARLPMVKSAVRAMDTIQSHMGSDAGGGHDIRDFVVAGGSKRGWTTWLTGAADRRVSAIIPIVIDVLNVKVSMDHHFAAYGFWAPAIGDYVHHRITTRSETPEYAALLAIVDPFNYRHRLEMPKFIVNATGDEFFLPDSSQFYFDELRGEKHLRYVPNTNHSLRDSDALESIHAFYLSHLNGNQRPRFSWTLTGDGAIHVRTQDEPESVVLWQATNPKARDFRVDSIGRAYRSSPLEPDGDGIYIARVAVPDEGWTAFFAELTYPGAGPHPLKFTTQVHVVPDVLPHKDKPQPETGDGAGGE